MAQSSSNLVLSFLLFSLFIAAVNGVDAALEGQRQSIQNLNDPAGQWLPIKNLNDPHVVELAKFAVSEYNNRSKAKLTFVEVSSGEKQFVLGMNYKLVLTAKNGSGSSSNYETMVWEKASLSKQLISFKQL